MKITADNKKHKFLHIYYPLKFTNFAIQTKCTPGKKCQFFPPEILSTVSVFPAQNEKNGISPASPAIVTTLS